jgi:hypothetical protein
MDRRLILGGCSHIWGKGLEDSDRQPSNKTYIHQLAGNDFDIINASYPGSSNQTINRRVMNTLQAAGGFGDLCVFVQWSAWVRIEIPHKIFQNVCHDFPYGRAFIEMNKRVSGNKDVQEWSKNLYKDYLSDVHLFQQTLQSIIMLNRFCAHNGIEIINLLGVDLDFDNSNQAESYFVGDNETLNEEYKNLVVGHVTENYNYLEECRDKYGTHLYTTSEDNPYDLYTQTLVDQLQDFNWIDFNGESYMTFCNSKQFEQTETGHFKQEAHDYIAQTFDNIIKQALNV